MVNIFQYKWLILYIFPFILDFMLRQDQIADVIDSQKELFFNQTGMLRDSLETVPSIPSYATIITGIRRCGKSTLLLQISERKLHSSDPILYLHFEDIRLAGFESADFERLYREISKRHFKTLFFDEIQFVSGWEIFIRQLLSEGYMVFITGSNASLLSRELGTHLTGRHVSIELFPFSYREFLRFKNLNRNENTLSEYLEYGGLPIYVKESFETRAGLLNSLIDDILIRDIAVRHSIKDVSSLRSLAVYLMSNVGNPVSANKLTGVFGIKSGTTILDYFSYFKDSYLFEFLPQFSWSVKAQSRNPKKVYAIDTGFIREVSSSFTDDKGHKFENLIYLHLRRQNEIDRIFYFKEKGECDFVAFYKEQAQSVIQVCFSIDNLNFEREMNGLVEAALFFGLQRGTIVTFNQKDKFERDGVIIDMIPAHEFLD